MKVNNWTETDWVVLIQGNDFLQFVDYPNSHLHLRKLSGENITAFPQGAYLLILIYISEIMSGEKQHCLSRRCLPDFRFSWKVQFAARLVLCLITFSRSEHFTHWATGELISKTASFSRGWMQPKTGSVWIAEHLRGTPTRSEFLQICETGLSVFLLPRDTTSPVPIPRLHISRRDLLHLAPQMRKESVESQTGEATALLKGKIPEYGRGSSPPKSQDAPAVTSEMFH